MIAKGASFCLFSGTSGIIVALIAVGISFLRTEKVEHRRGNQIQALVGPTQELTLHFDQPQATKLLSAAGYTGSEIQAGPRFAGHHLFVWRFHRGHRVRAFRRCRNCADRNHARYVRALKQD